MTIMEPSFKPIQFSDIPNREELRELTIALMRKGATNSELMRDEISRRKLLILRRIVGKGKMSLRGRWNETPTEKFINEHAWVLEDLVVRRVIEKISTKEYRLNHSGE
jgi:hypothetical protein